MIVWVAVSSGQMEYRIVFLDRNDEVGTSCYVKETDEFICMCVCVGTCVLFVPAWYLCVCVCLCMCMCICVCVCVFVCVCLCVCLSVL